MKNRKQRFFIYIVFSIQLFFLFKYNIQMDLVQAYLEMRFLFVFVRRFFNTNRLQYLTFVIRCVLFIDCRFGFTVFKRNGRYIDKKNTRKHALTDNNRVWVVKTDYDFLGERSALVVLTPRKTTIVSFSTGPSVRMRVRKYLSK